eukprot:SAG31_NODE_11513_length_1022_cov_1.075840_1_plen_281_part_10
MIKPSLCQRQEVAITILGVVLVYDVASHPWLHPWIPFPRRNLVGFFLRALLVIMIVFGYIGVRAAITADSGKQTLEGSQLLRRSENPFAQLTGRSRYLSLLYLQAYYGHLLIFPSQLCCEYSYNCIPVSLQRCFDPYQRRSSRLRTHVTSVRSWHSIELCSNLVQRNIIRCALGSLAFWMAIVAIILYARAEHQAAWCSRPKRCIVLWTFVPVESGDLHLREGEVVAVVRHAEDNQWWEGWDSAGIYGRFPASYVLPAPLETKDNAKTENTGSFALTSLAW